MQLNWVLWPWISHKVAVPQSSTREGSTSLLIHGVVGRIRFPMRFWFLAIQVSPQSTSQHGSLLQEHALTGKDASLPKSQNAHVELKLTRCSLFQGLQNFPDEGPLVISPQFYERPERVGALGETEHDYGTFYPRSSSPSPTSWDFL